MEVTTYTWKVSQPTPVQYNLKSRYCIHLKKVNRIKLFSKTPVKYIYILNIVIDFVANLSDLNI